MIDGILKKIVADIKQAVEKSRRSFDRRIHESKLAKAKLEDQIRDVNLKKNDLKLVLLISHWVNRKTMLFLCVRWTNWSNNWKKRSKRQRRRFETKNSIWNFHTHDSTCDNIDPMLSWFTMRHKNVWSNKFEKSNEKFSDFSNGSLKQKNSENSFLRAKKTSSSNVCFSLDESNVRLRNLDRQRLILEKDLQTKTNTIFVDEVECHEGLRKSIAIEDWWSLDRTSSLFSYSSCFSRQQQFYVFHLIQ